MSESVVRHAHLSGRFTPPPPPPAAPPHVRHVKIASGRGLHPPRSSHDDIDLLAGAHTSGSPVVGDAQRRGNDGIEKRGPLPPQSVLVFGREQRANRPVARDGLRIATTAAARISSQQQGSAMVRLLQGLEEDDLTVRDVVGTLETEIKQPRRVLANQVSNQPSAAPLNFQATTASLPLSNDQQVSVEIAHEITTAPSISPESHGLHTSTAEPGIRVRVDEQDVVITGETTFSSASQWVKVLKGVDDSRMIIEKQLRAVAHALATLGGRLFNWSLGAPLSFDERIALWQLILLCIGPCAHVDEKLAETCTGFHGALSTASHTPSADPTTFSQFTHYSVPRSLRTLKSEAGAWKAPPAGRANLDVMGEDGLVEVAADDGAVEVSVCFECSQAGRNVSGVYRKNVGMWFNERAVYTCEKFCMLYQGRAWIIKGGPVGDARAEVIAYTQDTAREPYTTVSQWRVSDGSGGFVVEPYGCVLPGATLAGQRENDHILELTVEKSVGKLGWTSSVGPLERMFVETVEHGGWAARCGLEPGDELVELGGRLIATLNTQELAQALARRPQTIVFARGVRTMSRSQAVHDPSFDGVRVAPDVLSGTQVGMTKQEQESNQTSKAGIEEADQEPIKVGQSTAGARQARQEEGRDGDTDKTSRPREEALAQQAEQEKLPEEDTNTTSHEIVESKRAPDTAGKDDVRRGLYNQYSARIAKDLAKGHNDIRQAILNFLKGEGRPSGIDQEVQSNFSPFEYPRKDGIERITVDILVGQKTEDQYEVTYKLFRDIIQQ